MLEAMTDFAPCNIAFKEWASICTALAAGGQTIILRKGGIAEEGDRFRAEHPRFWLYPTEFHQAEDQLRPEAAEYFPAARELAPRDGRLPLGLFCEVAGVHVFREDDWPRIEALQPLHFWTVETICKRFDYRKPGLTLLAVRVYRRPLAHALVVTPEYDGCRTWVTLHDALSADHLQPVFDDTTFAAELARLKHLVPALSEIA